MTLKSHLASIGLVGILTNCATDKTTWAQDYLTNLDKKYDCVVRVELGDPSQYVPEDKEGEIEQFAMQKARLQHAKMCTPCAYLKGIELHYEIIIDPSTHNKTLAAYCAKINFKTRK